MANASMMQQNKAEPQ